MSLLVNVAIHPSQFPEAIRRDLAASLRTRQVNQKFHYDSVKQTQKWLALHQAYSPSRTDPDCTAIYDRSFEAAAARLKANPVHLIGLGCGGGQKDARLLKLLRNTPRQVSYTPADVSTAMALVAREAALQTIAAENCFPLVCDLQTTADWRELLAQPAAHQEARLLTFFGMLPNFEPDQVLPRLAGLLRSQDHLLLSVYLAPGADYTAGVRRILPQYDNDLTREWLLTFLLDLGVERKDGELRFAIEQAANGLQRVTARFHFAAPRQVLVDGDRFDFGAGDSLRLFFSYRYTAPLVRALLQRHGLQVHEQWLTSSEEEGVFLATRE